jgi:undecaprenyl diphosphate synthase
MLAMSRSPLSRLHVAIIMDGNGRWAEQRGLPRSAGHVAGARAVQRVVRAALTLPISDLTLFALSSENWRRPRAELDAILDLLHAYLESQTTNCVANGVRLCVIGRRDRLSSELLAAIEASELATAHGERLTLRLAIDYSSRDAIVRAARRFNVQAALGEGSSACPISSCGSARGRRSSSRGACGPSSAARR